jgi:hypothetical protein
MRGQIAPALAACTPTPTAVIFCSAAYTRNLQCPSPVAPLSPVLRSVSLGLFPLNSGLTRFLFSYSVANRSIHLIAGYCSYVARSPAVEIWAYRIETRWPAFRDGDRVSPSSAGNISAVTVSLPPLEYQWLLRGRIIICKRHPWLRKTDFRLKTTRTFWWWGAETIRAWNWMYRRNARQRSFRFIP